MNTTDTITSLDIQSLVGELPANSCESQVHGEDTCHADGEEQYVRVHLPCPCQNGVFVFCGRYIRYMIEYSKQPVEPLCSFCKQPFNFRESFTVLGPANQT